MNLLFFRKSQPSGHTARSRKGIAFSLLGMLCMSMYMSLALLPNINQKTPGETQVTSTETPQVAAWNYAPEVSFTTRPVVITDLDADDNKELWTFDNTTYQYKVYEWTAPNTNSLIYTAGLFEYDIEAANFHDLPTLDWDLDGYREYLGASTNFVESSCFISFYGNGSNNGIEATYDVEQLWIYDIPDQMIGLDFDGDSLTEFIVTTVGGDTWIYENQGGYPYPIYLTRFPGAIDLATCGDFDNDGTKDFFTGGNATDSTIRMWESSGNNAFTQAWSLNTGTQGCSLGIGDSDEDGANELYVNDAYGNNVSVFECTGNNATTFRTQFASPGGSGCFNVVDTDGNGKFEIIFEVNSSLGYKQIRDYEATADNTWALKWDSDPIPGVPGNVFTTDIDNDLFCELITNSWNNTLVYQCNVANGTLYPPKGLSVSINGGALDTKQRNVTLTLSAIGATQMCFSNDNITYSTWESYSTTKAWNLTESVLSGVKQVYFRARNATGTTKAVYDLINYVAIPAAPTLQPITPSTTSQKCVWLNWSQVPTVINYSVYRELSPIVSVNTLTPFVNVSAPATTFFDNTVESGHIYYYVVTASNTEGRSDPSACQSVNVTIPDLYQNMLLLLAKVDPLTKEIISQGLDFIANVTGPDIIAYLAALSGDLVFNRSFGLGSKCAAMGLALQFIIGLRAHFDGVTNRVEFSFSTDLNAAMDLGKLKFKEPFAVIARILKVMEKMGVSVSAKLIATLNIKFYFDADDLSFGITSVCLRINPSIQFSVKLIPLLLNLKPEVKQTIDLIQKPVAKFLKYDFYNLIVVRIELGVNLVGQYDVVNARFVADAQLVLNIKAELDLFQKSQIKIPEIALRLEGLVGVHFDTGASPILSLCGALTFVARVNTGEMGVLRYVINPILNKVGFAANRDHSFPILNLGSGCSGLVTCNPSFAADDPDNDSDYLSDDMEDYYGTNRSHPDTDNDGIWDYLEVQLGSDPLSPDTDDDTISDGDEYLVTKTNLFSNDTDGDGLYDAEELDIYGTNPCANDTDADGLFDTEEIQVYWTDPLNPDTDGDSYEDGFEVLWYGTDPLSSASIPVDTDGDGLLDKDETDIYQTSPTISNAGDTDGDLLSDIQEMILSSNPNSPDTDNDGLTDYEEYYTYHTCYDNADSDGDGYMDYNEIRGGFDPLDATSHPPMPFWLAILILSGTVFMVLVSVVRLGQRSRDMKAKTTKPSKRVKLDGKSK